MKPITQIVLTEEIKRARENFPGNTDMLAALTEEVGELAKALLDHKRGETDTAHVFNEAIQVACMAIRIAEEGDAGFPYEPHFWKGENGRTNSQSIRAITPRRR